MGGDLEIKLRKEQPGGKKVAQERGCSTQTCPGMGQLWSSYPAVSQRRCQGSGTEPTPNDVKTGQDLMTVNSFRADFKPFFANTRAKAFVFLTNES